MYINNLGHMTKMAAMPIYGKNPSKIFFSETNRLISRKLGVKHRWLKYSNVYINHDPVMTLTKFMARSTWVAYAFELTPPPARYSHAHPISIDKHCFFAPVFTCKKHVLVCLSNPRVDQPSLTVS